MLQNRRDVDIELASTTPNPQKRLEGYPSFAEFIARDKDAAIYRKFEHLSARSLLYLQSELHELEGQLQTLDAEDEAEKDRNNEQAKKIARYWEHYSRDSGRAATHRDLQRKIKMKVKEYRECQKADSMSPPKRLKVKKIDEAMILEKQILEMSSPGSWSLREFKKWFTITTLPVLWGRDRNLFKNERDLVALGPVETDRLNIILQKYCGWFFKVNRKKNCLFEI